MVETPQIVQIRRLFLKKKTVLASLSQLSYQADLSKPIIGAGLGAGTLEPDPGAGPWSRALEPGLEPGLGQPAVDILMVTATVATNQT